jgi:hypothetical protein
VVRELPGAYPEVADRSRFETHRLAAERNHHYPTVGKPEPPFGVMCRRLS